MEQPTFQSSQIDAHQFFKLASPSICTDKKVENQRTVAARQKNETVDYQRSGKKNVLSSCLQLPLDLDSGSPTLNYAQPIQDMTNTYFAHKELGGGDKEKEDGDGGKKSGVSQLATVLSPVNQRGLYLG